jgi:hypothetical protein
VTTSVPPIRVVHGAPMAGAGHGVVGASSTSTSRKASATRARYHARKRCARAGRDRQPDVRREPLDVRFVHACRLAHVALRAAT